MKAYIMMFKLKFFEGMQYRAAAISGIATQFAWGFLLITLYNLLGTDKMDADNIATYFWLNQAFIALLAIWALDGSIFMEIENGDVQYQLIKPQNIYLQWFVQGGGYRLSRTILRSIPIIVIASILPAPYRLNMPENGTVLIGFIISLLLGLLIQLAVGNIMGAIALKNKSSVGVRYFFSALYETFDGGNIPYIYFPIGIQKLLKSTFLYGIRTAPFLIYMNKVSIMDTVFLQLVWLLILVIFGYQFLNRRLKRIEVYGG